MSDSDPHVWPMDCSPPGSSVHGILQARILDWVAMPSSRRSSRPRVRTRVSCVSCLEGGFFTTSATWEAPESVNYSNSQSCQGAEKAFEDPMYQQNQCSCSSKHSPQNASLGPREEWASGVSLAWETLRWSKTDLTITADFLRCQYTTILHKVYVSYFWS